MAKSRNTFALGLTVIAIVCLFFVTLMFIGGGEPWGEEMRTVTVRFAHTLTLPPLKTGSPVLFAGQPSGRITAMWFEKGEYKDDEAAKTRKMVYLYVQADVQQRLDLREDCKILPESPVLGGVGILRILDQGKSDKPLGPDQVVEGQGMGGFAAVTDQISKIGGMLSRELDAKEKDSILSLIKLQLDAGEEGGLMAKLVKTMSDLNAISNNIKNELDPKQEKVLLAKLHTTLDHINKISGVLTTQMDPSTRTTLLGRLQVALDAVNESLGTINGMLGENRPAIRATLQNVQDTSETLSTGIAKTIAAELDNDNPDSLMAKIHDAVGRVGQSLEDLNRITSTTSEVVTLNKDSLNKILSNFKETSDHMKSATKDLRRNPWRLLYRPTLEETKELNIFDAARAFAEAATQLDDATVRLSGLVRLRKGSIAADDPQLEIIRAELQQTFKKFSEAEAALWKNLNVKR